MAGLTAMAVKPPLARNKTENPMVVGHGEIPFGVPEERKDLSRDED